MKRKHPPIHSHPIEILRRSLGLTHSEFSAQLGLGSDGWRLSQLIRSRQSFMLIPLIRERWGADITDKVIAHMENFFKKLKPVPLAEWEKKREEDAFDKMYYPPARDPYDPEDDLNEMVNRLESDK